MTEHFLIQGLLAELPSAEEGFPEDERQEWIDALTTNLGIIYRRAAREAKRAAAATPDPAQVQQPNGQEEDWDA